MRRHVKKVYTVPMTNDRTLLIHRHSALDGGGDSSNSNSPFVTFVQSKRKSMDDNYITEGEELMQKWRLFSSWETFVDEPLGGRVEDSSYLPGKPL